MYELRLPANSELRVGDTVAVSGTGAVPWRISQQDQQLVVTTGLPGNVVPGTQWTPITVDPALAQQDWVASASSASGNVLAAAVRNGGIYVSRDGGTSWVRSNAPATNWGALAMSPDGGHLVAADRTGRLYTSADGGASWTVRTGSNRYWGGVFISADGQRIVAMETGGSIHLSNDGGASFTAVPGTANTDWRRVAGSATGDRLVAVASLYDGDPARQGVYVSEDAGQTWTRRTTTGSPAPTGNWSFVAASHDGMRMAAIDNGAYPWISADGGATWQMRFSYSNWADVAVSGDGRVVMALEPRDDPKGYTGYTFVSPDGGGDIWHWYGENRWYSTVAMSFDGNNMLVGDAGPNGSGGLLYTSRGNRTSLGPVGSLAAAQAASIELRYEGDGRFSVLRQSGGPFSIR
ncbi:exo-alpha-sialidase [Ramlibacter rhizophilus]|uniref:Exo-alpha-sialidase n=1 Tax=Ramlibacter rhizophilus TaxID=1781167 RepID=A0A4Z0BRX3_9BURK|nr:exo-alpha-sialidase [Ramlibacter rhizophilus]